MNQTFHNVAQFKLFSVNCLASLCGSIGNILTESRYPVTTFYYEYLAIPQKTMIISEDSN